jgi:signal transduction histidine kinase
VSAVAARRAGAGGAATPRAELRARCARAIRTAGFVGASIATSVLGLLSVSVVAVGALLSLLGGLGLPVLQVGVEACRRVVQLERRAANRFVDAHIPPVPMAVRHTQGSLWRRSRDTLRDAALRRMVLRLLLAPLVTLVGCVAAFTPVVLAAWLGKLSAEALFGLGDADYVGPLRFGVGAGLVLVVLTIAAVVVAVGLLDFLHTPYSALARRIMLPRAVVGAPVRELLAESLGDHSVAIAYWLPDRAMFVDETGRRVELPHPASGRTWTTVEREGRPVAAIVHDAALDTSSELVQAAASAAELAIDNERLKADLRARLEELRVSRLRIVEATDAARRRIERDLHDGAQQQLVALALELRLLRGRLGGDEELTGVVDGLSQRLASALAELRELARGIHPSILSDQGLAPAIDALADRAPVEVRAAVDVEDRYAEPIEAAAYFVVSEALTNVAKYARASGADVNITIADGEIVVHVSDDGIGGVDVSAGSGLRGLQDRLAAVDGTLEIASPPGRGTRVRARIPIADDPMEDET